MNRSKINIEKFIHVSSLHQRRKDILDSRPAPLFSCQHQVTPRSGDVISIKSLVVTRNSIKISQRYDTVILPGVQDGLITAAQPPYPNLKFQLSMRSFHFCVGGTLNLCQK